MKRVKRAVGSGDEELVGEIEALLEEGMESSMERIEGSVEV